MDNTTNFEYKPRVKSKVSELEARLASLGNSTEDMHDNERVLVRRRSSHKEKSTSPEPLTVNNSTSNLNQGVKPVIISNSTLTDNKIPHEQTLVSTQINHLNKQSKLQINQKNMHTDGGGENKEVEKKLAAPKNEPKVPIPVPRRRIPPQNFPSMVEEGFGNESSNSPPCSRSSSSTRRSSEDDGIADMASESDPFDDSSMPLPKIKENAFLLKDRRHASGATDGVITAKPPPVPHLSNLRRGSLNPQMSLDEDREKRKLNRRTRTDSSNSTENFVVRQISTGSNDSGRRESQADIQIDVVQTDSGVRSPTIVRSQTLSNSAASILVLGLPQSGKSKTIDSLVQKQVASVESPSSSREIVEYTAKIKILDSSNLFTLKIIETPGYANDPTNLSDAQLMSTLVDYLDSKDGLRGRTPTIVLVVFRFDDQRLWNPEDEHPDIVNFLKLINNFQQNLNDNRHANFVFVLTHFLSENTTDQEQKRPQSKIVELINLIQKYTSLPLPIMVVCAENEKKRAEAHETKLHDPENNNGSNPMIVTLPNGETYPYNLIDKIKVMLTKKGRDSVGETVLRTAFGIEYPYSIKECHATLKIPLFPASHSSVQQMQKEIKHAYLDIERTEIFTLLEIGWLNIDPKIQEKFPESLFTVQQILQTKKVCNFNDIPEDPGKILNLVRQMPSNLAVKDLLIDTLQLKVPACYLALYIGQGFDLSKDTTTNVSPFQFATGLKTSPVGLIPNELQCKIRDDREISFKFFYEVEEYVSERLKDMNLRYSISPNSLSALSAAASSSASSGQRWGYNLFRKNQEPSRSTIATAIVEYRIFQITLHQQAELKFKPQFWEAVQEIADLDIKDPNSVTAWRDFFGYWGTHVVKSAFGGGSVEITFRGNILSKIFNSMKRDFVLPSDEYDTTRVFQWITGDGLDFVASCGKDVKNEFMQGSDVETHFHGGDIKYQQVDLTKLESKEEVANVREDWKESLAVNPVMLETSLVLVPLSYYVRDKSEGFATKIDVALHYFYSDFMVSQGKQSSCSIL